MAGAEGVAGMSKITSQHLRRSDLTSFFGEIGARLKQTKADTDHTTLHPQIGVSDLRRFFTAVRKHSERGEAKERLRDRREATRFSVFEFIEPDENKLSDILAMLLDPKGCHGQEDLFLRLLFKRLGVRVNVRRTQTAQVRREAPTHGILKYRRRMDVLIDAGALVAIENKTDSAEQPKQANDYLEHLLQSTRGRSFLSCLIYLTPNGRSPESLGAARLKRELADGRLHCWSYHRELREWLEHCRLECAAPRIRDFLSDLLAYIAVELKREPPSQDDESNED